MHDDATPPATPATRDEGADGLTPAAPEPFAASHAPTPSPAMRRRPHTRSKPKTDESIKETIESVIIAFIFAFVFRGFIVEAFIIPTGSMAPTLLGSHFEVQCPQCGYDYTVDGPDAATMGPDYGGTAQCPMCNFAVGIPATATVRAGDRILVHKYTYALSEPRRWDTVVFKAPHNPGENYIKRLAGLPGETLAIVDGDLFVKPSADEAGGGDRDGDGDGAESDWRIARKADPAANPHWEAIQRAVWQPIYHSLYVPLDGGSANYRDAGRRFEKYAWSLPWKPLPASGGTWTFPDGGRTYRFDATTRRVATDAADRADGASEAGELGGTLAFDFHASGDDQPAGQYPYNQVQYGARTFEPIEDIRLAAKVIVDEGDGNPTVELATTARLGSAAGPQRILASVDWAGHITVTAQPVQGDIATPRVLVSPVDVPPLARGVAVALELWFVDSTILVWIDGEAVVRREIPLDPTAALARGPAAPLPDVTLGITGGSASFRDVQLDRDLYYGSQTHDERFPNIVGLNRRSNGSTLGRTAQLNPDEFFCLGDNSPSSQDSRFWGNAVPWVQHLYNQDARRDGIVPRDLLIGRAFFVYYPAPHPLPLGNLPFISRLGFPNFGEMRFIH